MEGPLFTDDVALTAIQPVRILQRPKEQVTPRMTPRKRSSPECSRESSPKVQVDPTTNAVHMTSSGVLVRKKSKSKYSTPSPLSQHQPRSGTSSPCHLSNDSNGMQIQSPRYPKRTRLFPANDFDDHYNYDPQSPPVIQELLKSMTPKSAKSNKSTKSSKSTKSRKPTKSTKARKSGKARKSTNLKASKSGKSSKSSKLRHSPRDIVDDYDRKRSSPKRYDDRQNRRTTSRRNGHSKGNSKVKRHRNDEREYYIAEYREEREDGEDGGYGPRYGRNSLSRNGHSGYGKKRRVNYRDYR